jgi:flavin-dependent dehydrogenase
MTVEYDLIVIGGSTAGIYAAVAAAHLKARVALVEPQQLQTANWLGYSALYSQSLTQLGVLLNKCVRLLNLVFTFQSLTQPNSNKSPLFN